MVDLRAALLVTVIATTPVISAFADDSGLRSVALLWSPGGCVAAVSVAPGTFFTGARAFDRVCPGGVCAGVKLFVAAGDAGEEMVRLRKPRVSLATRVDSLDVAALAVSSPDLGYVVPTTVAEARTAGVIRVLDFPRCERLVGLYGVVGSDGAIEFSTTIRSRDLGAGAIVLDETGAVVGIVEPAITASAFVPGWLEQVLPLQASAVRVTAARAVLTGDAHDSLMAEVALWNRAYDEQMAAGPTMGRLRAVLTFRAGVGRVAARALTAEAGRSVADALAASQQLGLEFVARLAPAPPGALAEQGERLAVAYALATRGLLGPFLEPLDVDSILAAIRSSARSATQIARLESMVENERQASRFAPVGMLLVLVVLVLACLLAVTAAWAWSLGFVFKAARGSVLVRVGKTAAVGVAAWPTSLVVFWVLGAGLRKRREARALSLVPDGWTL